MLNRDRPIDLHGVALDLGGARRGTDMGPSAMRIAGVAEAISALGYRVVDCGDVDVESRERSPLGENQAKFLPQIARSCEDLRRKVRASLAAGSLPIVLGGDHSIAIGTIAGVAGHYREREQELGLLWIDAHADMNTPASSPTGNVHGMPLGVTLGMGPEELVQLGGFAPKVQPDKVALIGVRDLDDTERELVARSGVKVFTMMEVDRLGMSRVAEEALAVVTAGTAGFHVSLDLDGIDPTVAPGVGTPVQGGLSFRETHLLLELAAESQAMLALEIVELNPILDHRNATAEVAVGAVQSALGRRIL